MNDETLSHLLTEEEIRQQMSVITNRYLKERAALKTAMDGLAKTEAKAQLAITFLQPELLSNPDAKNWLTKAKTEGTKLIAADKEALVTLEIESKKIAFDLAKFDCDTSDKQYSKLEALLSYHQSLMKFTGQTESRETRLEPLKP
jgi:hypothetical protein